MESMKKIRRACAYISLVSGLILIGVALREAARPEPISNVPYQEFSQRELERMVFEDLRSESRHRAVVGSRRGK